MEGAELIKKERERQISEEGFDELHDRQHNAGELALAAIHYAIPDEVHGRIREFLNFYPDWDWRYDKKGHHGRIRDLVKAGALIAAEVDRLIASERSTP